MSPLIKIVNRFLGRGVGPRTRGADYMAVKVTHNNLGKGWLSLLVGYGLCVLSSGVWAHGLENTPLPTTVERIKPSIVAIGTYLPTRRPPHRFVGTGFVVGDGTYVLTNAHVISRNIDSQQKETQVVFAGEVSGAGARTATLVADDPVHDVSLLKISGAPLPAFKLGDSDRVREGEVYAFTGFPMGMILGFHPATHRGMVAAVTPIVQSQEADQQLDSKVIQRLRAPFDVFQLDATAYPGNSGSPLYHPDTGVVVAIINMVFVKESKETVLEKPSGIAYAIPINFAVDLLRKADVKF